MLRQVMEFQIHITHIQKKILFGALDRASVGAERGGHSQVLQLTDVCKMSVVDFDCPVMIEQYK